MTCSLKPAFTLMDASLPCHSSPAAHVIPLASNVIPAEASEMERNLWEAIQEAKTIMYGFRKHRSQATAQSSVGMTYLLRPAITLVKPSLLCHSCRGWWGRGNLWEAVQEAKPIMDGLISHRSQATAQSSVGMTYLLRPAFTRQELLYQLVAKEQSLFLLKRPIIQIIVVPLNREYYLVSASYYYELKLFILCLFTTKTNVSF